MTPNAYSASIINSEIISEDKAHISDEIFDGYEGLEITRFGNVGFNYALLTPDKKKEILIGFNPYLTQENSYTNLVYRMGRGWQIKLPYLDISNKVLYQPDGYKYIIKENKNGYIVDCLGTSSLTTLTDGFCFEKANGSKEFYTNEGKIKRIIDAFDNETIYEYSSGLLTKITYPDSTFVTFERNDLKIELKYNGSDGAVVFATFNLLSNKDGTLLLDTIEYDESNLEFSYNKTDKELRLSAFSIENKYCKEITYNENINRVQSVKTLYDDGTDGVKEYYYDAQGRISKIIDKGFAEEKYQYIQKIDGSLLTETTKIVGETESVEKETLNKYGQLIRYEENGSVLTIKYNQYNKVQQEKENNMIINYSYNPQGEVTLVEFPDGKTIKYDYYADGQLQRVASNEQTTYYTPQGEIQKIMSSDQTLFSDSDSNILMGVTPTSLGSGISVLYNINSSVGVTNYHTYYGLSQSGFNCYSYAIGKVNGIYNPGYFSKRSLNLNSITGIKTNVEKDVASLGMSIYNSTVSESIGSHCWKNALRIRAGSDYHFMSKGRTTSWGFKAGKGGPAMEVLNGKTPSSITWDTYVKPLLGNYKVGTSVYYNSSIYYMMIKD